MDTPILQRQVTKKNSQFCLGCAASILSRLLILAEIKSSTFGSCCCCCCCFFAPLKLGRSFGRRRQQQKPEPSEFHQSSATGNERLSGSRRFAASAASAVARAERELAAGRSLIAPGSIRRRLESARAEIQSSSRHKETTDMTIII